MPRTLSLVALSALALTACSGEDPPGDATPTPESATPPALTYHRDVAPILHDRCLTCHVEGRIAPFTLDRFEDVRALASEIAESTQARRMPPSVVDNSGACNTFSTAPWMSDAELDVLARWAAGPRAEGDPADGPSGPPPGPQVMADVGLSVSMAEGYTPKGELNDDYRCFVMDHDLSAPAFVTGFQVRPGDNRVVHHVILYDVSDDGGKERVAALDAEEDGPGYTCFGGPRVDLFTMLAAWAPGGPPTYFPEDTGLRVRPGSKMVMQVHYNTLGGVFEDRSAVDLRLSNDVSRQAQMLFLVDGDMVIPPGLPDASTFVESASSDLGATVDVTLYGVAPHMHTLGETLQMDYIAPEGDICLARVNKWDFNWQQTHFFDTPVLMTAEDLSRLTCTYDTRSRDTLTPWGDGTQDEMCLIMLYLTVGQDPRARHASEVGPAIPRPVFGDRSGPIPKVGWSAEVAGPQDETPRKVAFGPDGALWAAGYTSSPIIDLGDGLLRGSGRQDAYLTRFDPRGRVTLARLFGAEGSDRFTALDADGAGNAIVGGTFTSESLSLGAEALATAGEEDIFVAKISPEGEVLWARRFGGPGSDTLWWLSVGPAGEIALAGDYRGTVDFGAVTLTAPEGTFGGVLLVLSAEGEPIFAKACQGEEGTCRIRSVDYGSTGELAVGAYFTGEVRFGGQTLTSRGSRDGLLARVSPTGEISQVTAFGDTADDIIRAVAMGAEGDLIGAGYYAGTLRFGALSSQFKGSLDAFTVSIPRGGEARWLNTFGGSAGDSITDLAVLGDRIVATGYVEGPVDLGGGILGNAGQTDVFLLTLNAETGAHLASRTIGGVGSDSNPYMGASADRIGVSFRAMTPVDVDGEALDVVANGDAILLSLTP